MNNPTVSVIIPVYNSGKYLERCLNSIINQSWKELDVILVDDGSEDNSGEICDIFSERDRRIKVIHKNNEGVASARNRGIEAAIGEYITFVDSDDWIDVSFIEAAVSILQQNPDAGIFVGGMEWNYIEGGSRLIGIIGLDYTFNREEAINELFRHTFFRWELCGKVYLKELFDHFKCPENISMAEDLYCNWFIFNRVKQVCYSAKNRYHYFINEDSATHKFTVFSETTLDVYDSIFDSEYKLPYYARIMLMRNSIKFYAYRIRELYFEDSVLYADSIKKDSDRLKELVGLFPDVPEVNTGVIKALIMDDIDQREVFVEQFKAIKSAALDASVFVHIYIYGIGLAAEYIYRSLSEDNKIKVSFVVSDSMYSADKYCGKDVYRLSEIKPDNKNCVFVMSLRNEIRTDIVNNMRMLGYNNIIEIDLRNIYARIR